MASNEHLPPAFYIYSAGILIGPLGCLTCLILQIRSQRQRVEAYKIEHRLTYAMLLAIYTTGILCGIFGFTMHAIAGSGLYCERIGLAICFAFLGGGKDLLYLIFVQRAKLANGGCWLTKKQKFVFNTLFPIYVFFHWISYVAGTAVLFPGISLDSVAESNGLTHCVFRPNAAKTRFLALATLVDLANCLMFLYIFVAPLLQLIKTMEKTKALQNDQIDAEKCKLLRVMKWNATLSFIATFSSFIALLVAIFTDLGTAACLADPMVNSLCAYFMMQPNRSYAAHICCSSEEDDIQQEA